MSDGRYKLRAERCCRMCERPESVRPLTRHHVVPQSWFRESYRCMSDLAWRRANVNANVVPLCRPCHDLIDHGPWWERRRFRAMLRRRLNAGEVAHARRARGEWFDREYPERLRTPIKPGRLSETG